MLNILIENFDQEFIASNVADQQRVANCLNVEFENWSDIGHLEQNVIGEPLFQWDYRAIDEGLIDLMKPFIQSESYIPLFFMHLLRDLGCDPDRYKKASILLEYTYYAAGVVDLFNFHEVFTKKEKDLLKFSELTQIRYAVQYLMQYPRYLIIKNAFHLDDKTNMEIHKLYSTVGVATGMGRGVFLKWSNAYYRNFSQAPYLQNTICILNNYFLFPVVLAALISNVSSDHLSRLKHAFSALTVFAKLRLEKTICNSSVIEGSDEAYTDSLLLLTFPGIALIQENFSIDRRQFNDRKYPWIPKMHGDLLQMLESRPLDNTIEAIEELEHKYFNIFLTEINKTGLLAATVDRLRQCYDM